ncbi:hypothetical protein [Bacillus sp. OK048]|uniref:AbiJ-related protein n=1 Tax=Bacillus sp. OK048 TaxID=1882761 RepID=UPI00088907E8|nr:hypothetical protein [Bacillus sp. OK048]SDM73055.1 hypothetical protein SAMN05443253_105133 [Bacillus sp. OK048]
MNQNISKITRGKLVRELLKHHNIFGDIELMDFLSNIWNLKDLPSLDKRCSNAYDDIYTHYVHFEDYDIEHLLFERLDIHNCDDTTFTKFLETIVSPEVRDEIQEQYTLVDVINRFIQNDSFKLEYVKNLSGSPLFQVKHLKGNKKEIQQLFFACNGYKHRLIFRDATTNEIETTRNSDKVLCYKEPISSEGLLWTDLIRWYMKELKLNNYEQSEKELITRLEESMNPPEKLMFHTYLEFGRKLGTRMPAYIPQPYLKYDPYTALERNGVKDLERERMDFLLLFPHGIRILTEIDGQQHYSEENGQVSPRKYANMVREDREDKLMGYEVFRFGGFEFYYNNEFEFHQIKKNLFDFFEKLFRRYGLL